MIIFYRDEDRGEIYRYNHTEGKTLQEFLEFCKQYLEGPNGMLLDMPFFKRIAEGELGW